VTDAELLADEMDSLRPHLDRPVLVTEFAPRHAARFLVRNAPECPPPEAISRALPCRLDYARRHLLTNRNVAQRIVSDTQRRGYQTVAVLLVDGLSYGDTLDWPELPEPCFIDGPSITFARTSEKNVCSVVGFPAMVGTPPLARRLADAGIPHSRGYSYWDRGQNDVSAMLFRSVPLTKVNGVGEAIDLLAPVKLEGIYVQLVREGLDGLAHHRREVTTGEVQAAVKAVHDDYRRIINLLANSGLRGAAYLTADHGILWKTQHTLRYFEGCRSQHPRHSLEHSSDCRVVSQFEIDDQTYYLYHYPYLGSQIRANDSGVHGGLSYWESIVPFVRVEVNS
jgi:hypothetical protein